LHAVAETVAYIFRKLHMRYKFCLELLVLVPKDGSSTLAQYWRCKLTESFCSFQIGEKTQEIHG
jgi:hypothetical protein